ncbi:hypothetical protein [Heyndrickxia sporothermodurans]|uniref:hypothetical protein n=1 Tax=Heyndrickxia sporothermodurans TaxID=46224 RepID=UPI0035DA92BC
MDIPKLLSNADMAERWKVSRQVVNNWKLRYSDKFPTYATTVHGGKLPLYLLSDIEEFEVFLKEKKLLK